MRCRISVSCCRSYSPGSLQELNLAFNDLADLRPLRGCAELRVLTVMHNRLPSLAGVRETRRGSMECGLLRFVDTRLKPGAGAGRGAAAAAASAGITQPDPRRGTNLQLQAAGGCVAAGEQHRRLAAGQCLSANPDWLPL